MNTASFRDQAPGRAGPPDAFADGEIMIVDHLEPKAMAPVGPRGLAVRLMPGPDKPRYSICVMVTKWDQYAESMASYRSHGFDDEICEFLLIDNSAGNRADAYVALNEFLQAARGDYVILTHHDVTLIEHGRAELDACLDELTALDPSWAVCGNAGHTDRDKPVYCLSHTFRDQHVEGGPFPARVMSLDENFIVVRRLANLALSRDLAGFHHYGTDLCLIADILGWSVYVIGFHLRHDSRGTIDERYDRSREAIMRKYARALRPRWVHLVTLRQFYISGNGSGTRRAHLLRLLGKVKKRLRRYAGLG
jgi:hypothetical protein